MNCVPVFKKQACEQRLLWHYKYWCFFKCYRYCIILIRRVMWVVSCLFCGAVAVTVMLRLHDSEFFFSYSFLLVQPMLCNFCHTLLWLCNTAWFLRFGQNLTSNRFQLRVSCEISLHFKQIEIFYNRREETEMKQTSNK